MKLQRIEELLSKLFEVENLKQPLSGKRGSNGVGGDIIILRLPQTQKHTINIVVFIFFPLFDKDHK